MKTILVSGAGTDVGKTYFVRKLVRYLVSQKKSVQLIKPVETGIASDNYFGDMQFASDAVAHPELVETHTPIRFKYPMAPYDAAKLEHKELSYDMVIGEIHKLPRDKDYRVIEGAGGIAVPIDLSGKDWLQVAKDLQVDCLVLVVENKLGAINQSRLVYEYCRNSELNASIYLNQINEIPDEIFRSNYETLQALEIPVLTDLNTLI